ncbi:DUF3037 domain-containing protein [Terrimonas rubra]|uniref:DUF3037 domain-containing protein n=1 Tax=Terrimonas rubra TaxID=1035890 RepID=A0ABW6A8T4_9BACT
MQERHLYEYAVIRIVPRIEREEFINVGVILYCPKQKFLGTRISFNAQRLQALCPLTDTALVKIHLDAFEQIANGTAIHSPIARLDIASRFRWLAATRSTIIQTSKVHSGLCLQAQATLDQLHEQLIL